MNKEYQYHMRVLTVCEALEISYEDYMLFRRRGAMLHTLYERDCNGYADYYGNYDEKASKRGEQKQERIQKLAEKQAKELELYIYFQTDPRGATIYLSKDPIADNNYNRSGTYCIY
jgi:hypothetical protein